VLDQLLLAEISVQELFREVDAWVVDELNVRLQAPIERHRDFPRTL
jgi:hypothetical protein